MVNIPPIPPLLCSTPPPIDFGEDDEDLDIMPPSLEDAEDDFGGFLVGDGLKTDEPLPSPRPPSVCELPSISIYDNLIPPEEEELTSDSKIFTLQSTDAKKTTQSENVAEAFNFEIKKSTAAKKEEIIEENKSPAKSNETTENLEQSMETENVSSNLQKTEQIAQAVGTSCLSKNFKDLKIETVNGEVECIVNKSSHTCIPNMVSIEDIEDDLSDDELYSPKTPKNFTETDNITDFFKIEEIKQLTTAANNLQPDSKIIYSESSESKDNNKSASLDNKNDNELSSLSSNSFIQDQFDQPPPLSHDLNTCENADDDDFGDYADFQAAHFVNNKVPVENVYTNQYQNDLEINDLNCFNNYNNTEDFSNFSNSQIHTNKADDIKNESEKMGEDFANIHSNNPLLVDEFITKAEDFEKHTNVSNAKEEFKNEQVDSLCRQNNIKTEYNESDKQLSHVDNSKTSLSEVAAVDDNNEEFGNFAQFPSTTSASEENMTVKITAAKEACFSNLNSDNDDEFSDFTEFESHQTVIKSEETPNLSFQQDNVDPDNKDKGDCDDDDDDFGDFNTAVPFTTTTPSSIVTNASHNISSQTPVIATNNLNERISKILQLMFDPNVNLAVNDSAEIKTDKIKDIPFTSIDAAKALEYQWLNSDTRHSFIRSLGIDSRNILYGDNWNPSLPRFAANLSFNPLKPMKPVPSSNVTGNTISTLESIPAASTEANQAAEISGGIKKETFDFDWKSSIAEEQTTEAFKENNMHAPIDAATSMPYISNEPQTIGPESLAVFENAFDNEGKLPKTPPISEMESIASFASSLPAVPIDKELSASQTELEEDTSSLNVSEVVATSTFTGSFKETHIYTPSKTNEYEIKHATTTSPMSSSSPTKSSPIDFDYEKAAMGVIIDETVVKKEYRDVEYNPPFTIDSLSKSVSPKMEFFEANNYTNKSLAGSSLADKIEHDRKEDDANDDFSEFQSVSSEVAFPADSLEVPKTATVSHGGMILSPAILIPQAISLQNQKPKIEWGDSAATINPEELARIEELFPEPKSLKSSSSSQKSTPTHQVASAPTISATVANKELEGNINNINDDDDDDWSDFVSVTVTNNIPTNRTGSNNNFSAKSPAGTVFQQRYTNVTSNKIPPATASNSNNDDEWSDFVSSAPPPMQQSNTYRVPQFNSGAWQNANFYNNPLSLYHRGPLNIPTTAAVAPQSNQKYLYSNNNNYNFPQQPYPTANNIPPTVMTNNHQLPHNSYKQQIHVMQNFSTAPVPTPERLSAAAAAKNNQFQSIGSAKVAPSIALIPDLGFVAPAIPTHTSFINSLPKPSINMKK